MHLLVALSTSVAYIASVGIMIRDVVQGAGTARKVGSETTYFDCSVFIIFFILIGRVLEGRAKVRVSIQAPLHFPQPWCQRVSYHRLGTRSRFSEICVHITPH